MPLQKDEGENDDREVQSEEDIAEKKIVKIIAAPKMMYVHYITVFSSIDMFTY